MEEWIIDGVIFLVVGVWVFGLDLLFWVVCRWVRGCVGVSGLGVVGLGEW